MDLTLEFYIAQAISIAAAVIVVLMMQLKNLKIILLGHLVTNLMVAATYFLLNSFSGAGICFIAIFQSIVMYFYNQKNTKPHLPVIAVFIALYIGCSIACYKIPVDILSGLAAVFFAISLVQPNAKSSRRWFVINPLLWSIYDFYQSAYVTLAIHIFIFASTVFSIVRNDLKKTKNAVE